MRAGKQSTGAPVCDQACPNYGLPLAKGSAAPHSGAAQPLPTPECTVNLDSPSLRPADFAAHRAAHQQMTVVDLCRYV